MVIIAGLTITIAMLTAGLVMALNRVGEIKSDLIIAERDRDGLRVIVDRQRKLMQDDAATILQLRAAISTDASGRVGRGERGRFVSVKR